MASPKWMTVVLLASVFAGNSVAEDAAFEAFVADILQADVVAENPPVQAVQIIQAEPVQVQAALKKVLQAKAQEEELAARKAKWAAQVASLEAELNVASANYQRDAAIAKAGNGAAEAAKAATESKKKVEAIAVKLAALKKANPDQPATEEATSDGPATDEAEDEKDAKPPVDPRMIKLQMSDGTIIKGRLETETIEIKTRFGTLEVPIKKIRYFRPGLNSKPNRKAEFEELVGKLGSDDASQRKAAADTIKKMGQPIKPLLLPYTIDANATRAKEAKTLMDWLLEQDDFDEFASEDEKILRMDDTIATTEFTMTGRIIQQSFKLQSDFGLLEMDLKDVVMGERETGEAEIFRKAFAIDQANLCARGFKTVGLRVEKGDKISIMASGTIGMTRWGSNAVATPEGAPNYGWYINGKIANGALCAKIGSHEVFKVGNKLKMVAKQSGTLQFGIGVTDRYAKSTSYRWPGSFKVKVQIERE